MPIRNDQINNDNDFDLQNQPLQNASAVEIESPDKTKAIRLITNNDGTVSAKMENTNNPGGPVSVRETRAIFDVDGHLTTEVFDATKTNIVPPEAIKTTGTGDEGKAIVVNSSGVAEIEKYNGLNLKEVAGTPFTENKFLRVNKTTGAWEFVDESTVGSGGTVSASVLLPRVSYFEFLLSKLPFLSSSFDVFDVSDVLVDESTSTGTLTHDAVGLLYDVDATSVVYTNNLKLESGTYQSFYFHVDTSINTSAIAFEYSADGGAYVAFDPDTIVVVEFTTSLIVKMDFSGAGGAAELRSVGFFYDSQGTIDQPFSIGSTISNRLTKKYTGYNLGSAFSSVPTGGIILWTDSETCPSGYTRVTAFDNMFLRGAAAGLAPDGTTKGSNSHTHTGPAHTHAIDITTSSAPSNFISAGDPGSSVNTTAHTHTVVGNTDSGGTGNTGSSSNLPEYKEVILCKKD